MELTAFFRANPQVAIAFSGGVDSAYLLYVASREAVRVCAYYVKTAFQPAFELEDAKKLAAELGIELKILEYPILEDENIAKNDGKRCYYCKRRLLNCVLQAANEDGFSVLLDGTNADDKAEDRPGMQALRELSVRSPLRECGLGKLEIRHLSAEAGLFTHDKPAYACLATRIPSGQRITLKALKATEEAEAILSAFGFRDFRVRMYHGAARIQVKSEQMPLLFSRRAEILSALKGLYSEVFLDLEARE